MDCDCGESNNKNYMDSMITGHILRLKIKTEKLRISMNDATNKVSKEPATDPKKYNIYKISF